MASTTILLLSLLFLLCSTLNFIPTKSSYNSYINSIINNEGFSISLIHKDSPLSPLYNHSTENSLKGHGPMVCKFMMPRSRVGSSLLSSQLMNDPPSDISSQVVFDRCEYIASYYIGTPPQKVYAFIDTAGDITWTNAKTAFDSAMSTTYKELQCNDNTCKLLNSNCRTCNKNKNEACTYEVKYEHGPSTLGVLSKDKFWFDADPSGQNSPRDVGVLSFGHNHVVSPDDFNGLNIHGSLGLSRDPPFSLIHQLQIKRFSHCFVKASSGVSSTLHFGSRAVIHPEDATPLVQLPSNEPQLYYVDLEGISVGNTRVNIPPGIFKRNSDERRGGFLIDSGTRHTMLRSDAYDPFLNLVKQMVPLPETTLPPGYGTPGYEKEFCFKANRSDKIILDSLLPRVTLHFAGGVDLQLPNFVVYNFYGDSPFACLSILRSDSKDDVSFLGNIQMTNLNIGFDLENNMVSFTNTDCVVSGYNMI